MGLEKIPTNYLNQAKTIISGFTSIGVFNLKLEITLACDASNYGIGAVLSHKLPNGQETAIRFVSHILSEPEQKYSKSRKKF